MKTISWIAILLTVCLVTAFDAGAQSFYGFTSPFNFGTNTFIGGGAPGGSTNLAPYSWISGTNAQATNYGAYITNTWSGWVDNTKEASFCVQSGVACAAGPGTNLHSVVWMWEPSLDGVNPDSTANTTFWVTNGLVNTPSASGNTNNNIVTTNFPGGVAYGVGYFYLAGIINYNTNGIYGALTNSASVTNANGLSTNNFFLSIGAKKSLIIGP